MLHTLFLIFFKIGLFTIGGGYAMIPLIESEIVQRQKWITQQEFVDLLAVTQSTPGVFAVNMAVFIGYKLKGLKGSIICALGTILPSFTIILAIALFFQQFKEIQLVENIFKGIRPAVVALIVIPAIQVTRTAGITRHNIWIPITASLLIWLMGVSPIWIIIAAGLLGCIKDLRIKNKE